ncbi:LIM domain [Popillia japonica]|uniref:LIM domain n=1 Tax=Popillia japonica TaxID=7064 RepID=A0AAW1LY40_POPJA
MVICFTCNKRIEGQVLTALDKTYHPEHFVCEKCKKPICDNKFRTHDGRAYCEEDYNRMFVAQCFGCGQSISGKFISALGHDWHEEHFLCSCASKTTSQANKCKSAISAKVFSVSSDNEPICEKCS